MSGVASLQVPKPHRPLRFLVAGGINTAVGLAAFPALRWALPTLHYMGVLLIAQAGCLVFAFLTYKLGVFRTRGGWVAEFGRFASFYVVTYAANWIALPVMVELLRWHPVLSQLGFTLLVIIASYFWHARVTFSGAMPSPGH